MSPKHTNRWVLMFQPGAEARGTLGSVPIVLSCYITLSDTFTHIVLTLTPLIPSYPPPPSTIRPSYPPPSPTPPFSPPIFLGLYLPATTTVVILMLPAAVLPPAIAPVSDESQYNVWWCSGRKGIYFHLL